jgi:predicted phage terminase large subunit-like protein
MLGFTTARSASYSPAAFAQYATRKLVRDHDAKWKPARHLNYLSGKLVDVAEGRVKRLAIFMPPRSGKSRLLTSFSAWYLGRNPDRRVIWAGNEHTLAAGFSAQARDLLQEHGSDVFGVAVGGASEAKDEWGIEGHAGGMLARGIRGRLTGSGANLAVIDDPVKDPIEADSETISAQNADWYSSVLLGRLEPSAAVILCMQRWGISDLWSKVVTDEWEVVELPALARENDAIGRKPGAPLWPERGHTKESWEAKRSEITLTQGNRWWTAQYEGVARSAEASGFGEEMIILLDEAPRPEDSLSVRAWDTSGGGGTDYTAGVRMDLHLESGMYAVSDVVRGKFKPHELKRVVRQTARRDGHAVLVRIEKEPGGSGVMMYDELARELSGYAVKPINPIGKKRTRWEPLQAAMGDGLVGIVESSWTEAFVAELLGAGRNDDQIDAASMAYSALASERSVTSDENLHITII